MIDMQDETREQLLKWYEQPEVANKFTMIQLAQKIGISHRTLIKYMYHDKPVKIRTLALIKSFLKSDMC